MSNDSDFPRPNADQIQAAGALSTATLHEAAGKIGALPSEIKPVAAGFTISGPAFTVKNTPGDNLWLHRAIAAAQPADVLLVNGCVRDGAEIAAGDFPVFSRGLCIRGTGKDPAGQGFLCEPLAMGDCLIQPGDLVRADMDGVVVIPLGQLDEAIEKGKARDAKEADVMAKLRAGETTMGLYGWK